MKGLPNFPVKSDMWCELKSEKRPIVIYGMGNGADKLIDRFERLGIKYADIFASDGFVRGHSFHGIRVKSLSEIKELYSDFVIVLSFATRLPEVIDTLLRINEKYELYIPDMPVSEESVYFDKDFFNSHYDELVSALGALEDEESKNVFGSIIRYKLSGRIEDLLSDTSTKEAMYSLFSKDKIRTVCDAGAYTGDTLSEAIRFFPGIERAACIEPDKKTFKRLLKYTQGLSSPRVECINAAAWSEAGEGIFAISGNRNSAVKDASTHSFEHRTDGISLVRIDDCVEGGVDYIKYDVEGSEREALAGSSWVIEKYRPELLVSLYHKSRDIFELINDLVVKYPYYKFYLRRLYCVPAWEINLIMIP